VVLKCRPTGPHTVPPLNITRATAAAAAAGLVGPGIDNGQDWTQAGVAALVLKPTILGGMERTLALAAWAQRHGMRAVVSSAFESPLGLSQWAQLAAAVDAAAGSPTHHGLATLGWFAAQPCSEQQAPTSAASGCPEPFQQQLLLLRAASLVVAGAAGSGPAPGSQQGDREGVPSMGIALEAAQQVWRGLAEPGTALGTGVSAVLQRASCRVTSGGASYTFSLLSTAGGAADDAAAAAGAGAGAGAAPSGPSTPGHASAAAGSSVRGGSMGAAGEAGTAAAASEPTTVLFLHGFMGSADDWAPFMAALSAGGGSGGRSCRCIALDLPGHGGTSVSSSRPPLEDSLVDEVGCLRRAGPGVALGKNILLKPAILESESTICLLLAASQGCLMDAADGGPCTG
jgi:isochorismate synthase/2-succinyl-5-enolpyruvyl-6-hydroxy-3-cyclohexene-1-carboxylate synthase/2-succinyl-6-hydroxy-2,4-cyclohexadiene-1-carboxylate synthase/O-succinylbenzoate synthase